MEYRITCLACTHQVSEGGLGAAPTFTAAEVLAKAQHNPGCDLSNVRRGTPTVYARTTQESGVSITHYTIQPGAYTDAVMIVQ